MNIEFRPGQVKGTRFYANWRRCVRFRFSGSSVPRTRLRLPTVRPLWTYVILALNVAVFIAMEWAGGSSRRAGGEKVLAAFRCKAVRRWVEARCW